MHINVLPTYFPNLLYFRTSYNTSEGLLEERNRLDRRRLEDGHLQYAMLKVIAAYPERFSLKEISFKNIGDALLRVTPTFHEAFTARFAGKKCIWFIEAKAIDR